MITAILEARLLLDDETIADEDEFIIAIKHCIERELNSDEEIESFTFSWGVTNGAHG